jgi:hypothetical protein
MNDVPLSAMMVHGTSMLAGIMTEKELAWDRILRCEDSFVAELSEDKRVHCPYYPFNKEKEPQPDNKGNGVHWCATPDCWRVMVLNLNDPHTYFVAFWCRYPRAVFGMPVVERDENGNIVTVRGMNGETDVDANGNGLKETDYFLYDVERKVTYVTSEIRVWDDSDEVVTVQNFGPIPRTAQTR